MTIPSVITAGKNNRLDLKTTLFTGHIAFGDHKSPYFVQDGQYYLGQSHDRAFFYTALQPNAVKYEVIAHELVHQFQYRDFQVFNSWLKPLETKVNSKILQTAFSKYVYFDVPYFWPAYLLEGYHEHPHYYQNFFEFEAARFSTNQKVSR